MKHKWLFNALAVLFLVTSLFGSFANTPVAVAASAESNAADKIEPALLDKFALEGTADFIVRFTEQADLSAASQMNWHDRGVFVYNTLKETAATSQAQAKGMLDAAGLEYQTYIAGNDLFVKGGNLDVATALAALDAVYYIRATRTYYIDPVEIENPLASVAWSGDLLARGLSANIDATTDWGITDTKADQFWTAFGIQGDGIKVANIDTGVQWDHPGLDQSFACGADPTDPACWADPSNICGGSACDNNGHGTHTMGTMVSDDDPSLTYIAGMAPNSTWIACKGCETNSCSDTALNACADWILAPGGDPDNRPNVVNNSWGGGGGDNWYQAKVQAWVAAGTFPAFSAGNNYSCNSLGSPGDYQESFGTASHMSNRNISDFSSKGPSAFGHDPYTKPNISAPGSSICSTVPTDGWSCGYSGTSMASPHTAGAVALLWSCNPGLIGDIDTTFQALQSTADVPPAGSCGAPPDGEGNYTFGYGYLNALALGEMYCGQVNQGTLEGYVFDNYGNPLEGASVQAQAVLDSAGIQATTDPNGFYSMNLVEGFYDVTASKVNYTPETQFNVEVISGAVTTLPDFVLNYLGAWTLLDPLPGCPDWTRYDGEFFAGDGMVYFMGGRGGSDGSVTYGDIYALDPNLGECTDTGADMPVPISNYTIVPVNDGSADVLCTFGGRDSAGGYTDAVQCYDPIANTVSQPTTLPGGLVGFIPGGSAAVDNMAYVFGGFRNTTTPYHTSETWEWDPVSNSWTQMADLVLGMGYIQVAAADGLIYGFGGDVFDGTNLVAQTVAQVFDPATGNWTQIADLPVAGGEGRAYGFDTASSYELAGQIIVAGGGQWPGDTYEVFLYDIATDSYDYSFPDLNITRRNHAGVFVPGDPGTMWVFGGRSGADTPPYGAPEYYEVGLAVPDIAVDPTFLDELVFVDTPKTVTLDVMNVGGGDLNWTITEIPGLKSFETITFPAGKAGEGAITANGAAVPERSIFVPTAAQPSGPFVAAPAAETVADGAGVAAPIPTGNVAVYVPHDVLWDNGPLVTHPGGGFGGADASVLQTNLGLNTYGFGAQVTANNSMADDFTVGTGGWTIDSFTFFAYQTNAPYDPSPIFDVRVQIWDGDPMNDPGATVVWGDMVTNRFISATWPNMFRVVDYDMLNTARAPVAVEAAVGTTLPEGTYWVQFMFDGSASYSGPWAPPVSILGETQKPGANGLQNLNGVWQQALDTGLGTQQDLPFLVNGTGGGETPPDVLLLAADEDNTYGSPIQAMLQAFGDLGVVDLYDASLATPSLAELQAYDVVVVWSNYSFFDATALGDVLADYVDAGGKVINSNFSMVPIAGYALAGRFVAENYPAMWGDNYSFGTDCLGTFDADHPIMAGVSDVCEYYFETGTYLTPGSSEVASWLSGELFVAAKDNGTVVTINGYVGYYYLWTGQMDLVLHNAILWLAGGAPVVDVPWLSEDPVSGTNDVPVAVTFDPTGLPLGQYFATLAIESNDEDEPMIYVPVTMTIVEEIPDIEVDPLAFDVTVFVDETLTEDLDISNVGVGALDWAITEIPGLLDKLGTYQQPDISGGNVLSGLSATAQASPRSVPAAANPEAVLWDQYANWSSTDLAAQDFEAVYDIYDIYAGDDFVNADPWSIETIATRGGWGAYVDLNNATAIHWYIYADDGGKPAGFPGDNLEVWSISLPPNDPQVALGVYEPEDVILTLDTPIDLPAGDWWLVYFVSLEYGLYGQYGISGTSDAVQGNVGMQANPGGGFGMGSDWWANTFGLDYMFRLEGEIVNLDVPWLSEDPTSGSTPDGETSTVAVTFDPSSVGVGQYFATLAIESDDPYEPMVYVPVTMTVIEKEAGVLLTPETDAGAGDPGATVAYTLTLENTGNIADTFAVEAAGVWDVSLSGDSFDLEPGEMVDVVVEVTIPADAMAGDSDVTTVTATSAFDDGVTDSSDLTTTANQTFGIELSPATAALSGAPGDVMTYTLTLTNTGNGEDTVALTFAGNVWDVELPVASFDLAAGESVEVTVLVTIAADAVNGEMDEVTVTATSEGGPTASSVLTTTAVVEAPEGFFLFLPFVPKN